MKKSPYPIDKRKWSPSLIPGAIVLISTINNMGIPNIAPKSWIQMVSFDPPMIMFSGTKNNTTEKNILETNSFVVNIVDSSLTLEVFNCLQWHGEERIKKTSLTLIKSEKIKAPLIKECKAHIECILRDTKEIGSGFIIFGEIVAISLWDTLLQANLKEKYQLLDQIVFLENGIYTCINEIKSVQETAQ